MRELTEKDGIVYRCASCGSDDLQFDALARWDARTQSFEMVSVTDAQVGCNECSTDWQSPIKDWVQVED